MRGGDGGIWADCAILISVAQCWVWKVLVWAHGCCVVLVGGEAFVGTVVGFTLALVELTVTVEHCRYKGRTVEHLKKPTVSKFQPITVAFDFPFRLEATRKVCPISSNLSRKCLYCTRFIFQAPAELHKLLGNSVAHVYYAWPFQVANI